MIKNFLILIGFILLAQSAGLIGSYFTFPSLATWYAELEKPFFSPPNSLFGPVWTILYTLMGIAAFLVYKKGKKLGHVAGKKRQVKEALYVFYFQLALNSLWAVLFFGFQLPLLAFIEIIVLWIAIGVTIQRFARVKITASLLLLPYILWVTFALMLNLAIVLLN
jgi:benzodiazapine receptor